MPLTNTQPFDPQWVTFFKIWCIYQLSEGHRPMSWVGGWRLHQQLPFHNTEQRVHCYIYLKCLCSRFYSWYKLTHDLIMLTWLFSIQKHHNIWFRINVRTIPMQNPEETLAQVSSRRFSWFLCNSSAGKWW